MISILNIYKKIIQERKEVEIDLCNLRHR